MVEAPSCAICRGQPWRCGARHGSRQAVGSILLTSPRSHRGGAPLTPRLTVARPPFIPISMTGWRRRLTGLKLAEINADNGGAASLIVISARTVLAEWSCQCYGTQVAYSAAQPCPRPLSSHHQLHARPLCVHVLALFAFVQPPVVILYL